MILAANGKGKAKFSFALWMGVIVLTGSAGYTATIADSVVDFSGTQGTKNWYYGRGVPFSETNPTLSNFINLAYYNGGGTWKPDIATNSPQMTATGGHPGWEGSMASEWAVRKYISTYSGLVRLSGSSQHTQTGGGEGTAARLIVDGLQMYVKLMPANGGTAGPIFDYALTVKLNVNSTIYMAIDDRGNPNNDFTDFKLKVESLTTRSLIADSYRDFTTAQRSPDMSGSGHWQYGERIAGVFSTNGWGYYPAWGAWTNSNYRIISSWGQHPYLNNSKLVTRRWTSGTAGRIIIEGGIRKSDEQFPGDGVIVALLLNGASIYSATLNGVTNLNGIGDAMDVSSRLFALTNAIAVGDTLDLTIDPRGDNNNDIADFFVTISANIEGAAFKIR